MIAFEPAVKALIAPSGRRILMVFAMEVFMSLMVIFMAIGEVVARLFVTIPMIILVSRCHPREHQQSGQWQSSKESSFQRSMHIQLLFVGRYAPIVPTPA